MFNDYSVVVSLGHQTITVIPVLDGKPDVHNARRINLGKLYQEHWARILCVKHYARGIYYVKYYGGGRGGL